MFNREITGPQSTCFCERCIFSEGIDVLDGMSSYLSFSLNNIFDEVTSVRFFILAVSFSDRASGCFRNDRFIWI